jgi:NAD(P)-dependent dehydrogenase (short-subunit alcohol dehydrogenase family)
MSSKERLIVREFSGKNVVVTGAASGIGRETALAFARLGASLALADLDAVGLQRVKEELKALGCDPYIEQVDVSDPAQVERFCNNVYDTSGRVDVLVNNAGVGIGGKFEHMTLDDWNWIVGVNLWGVVHGCHYFYPKMIAQDGGGHIVNTASGAGLTPLPTMTAYCCTKSAVLGFSETLRAEAALHGIGVSAICPGFIRTNITKTSRYCSDLDSSAAQEFMARVDKFYERRNYPPSKVAANIVKAVEKNKGVVPVSPEAYVGDVIYRMSRRLWDAFLTLNVKIADRFM